MFKQLVTCHIKNSIRHHNYFDTIDFTSEYSFLSIKLQGLIKITQLYQLKRRKRI
jgi:hypothetical protein